MKVKSILFLIATLIIGFVLGMLVSAQIRFHRLNPVRLFFSEERFREGFYRALQPDEKQKEKIDVVLDKYARINSELQSNFRKEFEANMKNFRKEIDTYLTSDQIERLKEIDKRRQEMIHRNRMIHERDSTGTGGERRYRHEHGPAHEDDRFMPPPAPSLDRDSSVSNK